MTIIDQDYPKALCNIYRPPFVLFYDGNLAMVNNKNHKLAICGTTKPDETGLLITKMLTKKIIKRKLTLIVMLEKGINQCVIENLGLGNSVLIIEKWEDYARICKKYPDVKFQIVISESYQSNLKKTKYELYRIVVGLMDAIIIVQSTPDDDTHRLVALAKHEGKEVFCFPERITIANKNNAFIKNGAQLIENINDIFSKI
ncbi:DNA-processing protein DprA [Spiroplasma endosymbiont of Stenodema calcarata]|uniref:DNA-processing protein DprA n=1 Tax=Spiroplasma endosymbiont of Stenodema calcarata TaxID=3139328 RepID=UPI003CCA723A